jgi:thiamine-phosphate pyrophosphorylase
MQPRTHPIPRLVALSPGDLDTERDTEALIARVRELAGGGLRALLLREARLEDAAFLHLAEALAPHIEQLWIHDRVHVALCVKAAAIHLGFRSLPLVEVRRLLDAQQQSLSIGLSTHAHDDPQTWLGADYLFHGPFAATPSKAGVLEPVGARGLAKAMAARPDPLVPMFALGGIDAESAPEALATGAHGVAVLRALTTSSKPLAELDGLLLALSRAGF